MKYNWIVASPEPVAVAAVSAGAGVSPLLARCLLNRGLMDAPAAAGFLQPRLRGLADPFLIPNMERAVARLLAARAAGETVLIFGDYDVDGVTSTALLWESLTALGWKASYYLPNRLDEGYGLSPEAAEHCVKLFSPRLLLAVDCGSTAVGPIASLAARGIEVIVVDHHQVSDPAPSAVALVNPQLGPAFREMCSAGLAFKLVHGLLKRLRESGIAEAFAFDLRTHLDLAVLGTIADLVPLTGENRILARAGLERLESTRREGLRALKAIARVDSPVGAHQVGFQLGPRLNAAGRLEDAEEALRLLLSKEPGESARLAQSLDARNRRRQEIERAICEEAVASITPRFRSEEDYVIVEGRDAWHIGVVGIVASRVVSQFHRPTIIFGGDGGAWRGSGRSIEGFDLAAALRHCNEYLLRHGGHAMAAGLSMAAANLELFRARLNGHARSILRPEHLRPTLRLDAETTLAEMSLDRVEELARLEPCGMMNPAVRFVARNVSLLQPPQRLGKENQHVKFRLAASGGVMEAIWWNCGDAPLPKITFDIAFTPGINEYQGCRAVQLKVVDWRPVTI